MNTTRKKVSVRQCEKCPNVYMTVGSTPIGLAFPRPITKERDVPLKGVCPIHKKRVATDDPG